MKTTLITLSLLLSATSLDAGVRESRDFTLLAENAQHGKPRLRSAHAVADTAGSPMGGTGRSAHVHARFGHAGQLYDVAGGTLVANPSPVPETTAAQLTVQATLDDGTTLPGPIGVSAWQIVSGPVASVSPGGLVTTMAVWMTTPAVIRATVAGTAIEGQVTVQDSNPDNFGSLAGDGLEDFWQMTYFDNNGDGIPDLPAGPGQDADGDGSSNLAEWLAGTSPVGPQDRFRLEMSGFEPGGVRLRFGPVLSSRRYGVLGRSGLAAPPEELLMLEPGTDAPWQEVLVPPPAAAAGFFQIRIGVK